MSPLALPCACCARESCRQISAAIASVAGVLLHLISLVHIRDIVWLLRITGNPHGQGASMISQKSHMPAMNYICRRGPITRGWESISPMFGDHFYSLDGAKLPRGVAFSNRNHPRLPVLLDPQRMLAGDHIPVTSWGSSLANLLTKSSWDALRLPRIAKNHNICEVCGKRKREMDVHEIWEYHLPEDAHKAAQLAEEGAVLFGRQKLVDIWPVCKPCHQSFHLGLASKNGRLESALERTRAINQWTDRYVEDYHRIVCERFLIHNEFFWALDLSAVADHPDGGLTVKSPWAIDSENIQKADRPADQQFVPLKSFNAAAESEIVTVLLGVRWRLAASKSAWYGPLSPASLEDGD